MTQEIPGLPANWPELTGQALANLPPDEFGAVWQAIGNSVRAAARAKVAARSETAAASAPLAEAWAQENISPAAAVRHDVAVEAFQAGYTAASQPCDP